MPFPMAQVLAQLEVLVPFAMHVCQHPSTGPSQEGSGTVPPSDLPPSDVPPSASMGSSGQNVAPLARKHVSALSAHFPLMHAAPR